MACSLPHTYNEIKSMVQKQIQEDRGRQFAIMNLAHQFDNVITSKDELRKAYEECRDIPLCFAFGENSMLLLWNPSIKKSVGISVLNYTFQPNSPKMLFGFGIHPITLEPTLLKINYPLYIDGPWYVSVSTLSSRTWYNLDYECLPRQSIRIKRASQAIIDGKIFWIGSERFYNDDGISTKIYLIVSFDLVTHQFYVQDMPEKVRVGMFSPPYYISQLGESHIISGSFDSGDYHIIYAWALEVVGGFGDYRIIKALDEEACLEEQNLSLMHRFADRFTNQRPKINRLNSLPDHPLIEYGAYAIGCMTGADMKKAAYLKCVRDELLRSREEKRQLIANYKVM
uniref:F-box domain-containing protein n=1 Tax=Tanacetum cinerariifolium TaxID=118510 RepID=A0A699GYL0_TANCI|nr:hypothetical protein [Tanacetum cinerariifolium]